MERLLLDADVTTGSVLNDEQTGSVLSWEMFIELEEKLSGG